MQNKENKKKTFLGRIYNQKQWYGIALLAGIKRIKTGLILALIITIAVFYSFKPDKQIDLSSFKVVGLNEIQASGWIKNLIIRDMTQGYLSVTQKLQPSLQHKVFGPNKVTNFKIDNNGDYTIRKETWWWGEHEGYMADLIIRSAFVTGDKRLLQKADSVVNYVLSNQEEDGYIGIYEKGHRLDQIKGENGELWSQSRILGALLAYYEFTGKVEVLKAVERAAKLTMSRYGDGKASYFKAPKSKGGGTAHGLMFIETLEMLYRLTGNQAYPDFAFWLYKDYSTSKITNNKDNQLENLLQKDLLFKEHGVHVLEHNRAVFWLSTLSKDPQYKTAFENIFYKLDKSTVPSGAMVSDEMVHQRAGDPNLFYEYCTLTERLISTFSGLQKTGRASYADQIENVVFNAAMGARLPDMSAIGYCTKDNRLQVIPEDNNFRFQYSSNHSPLCCNLSAGKLYPYYVSNLWMKTKDESGVVATTYGPSKLTTTVKGSKIAINELTDYPFENQVTFQISSERPTEFALICRKPLWADNVNVNAKNANISFRDGYYIITKKWVNGDKIVLNFESAVQSLKAVNGESYLRKGPLIYSLPLKEKREIVKTFEKGFHTYNMFPEDKSLAEQIFSNYKLLVNSNQTDFKLSKNPSANKEYPWDVPYNYLQAKFESDGKIKTATLYPMGSTVLRKVTFPTK